MYDSQFEEDLYQLRRQKLRQIGELGERSGLSYASATYPNRYAVAAPGWDERAGDLIPWLKARYDSAAAPRSAEELEAARPGADAYLHLAGRVMAIRVQGKAGFAQLQQGGQRLQIYVRRDDVGDDGFALYKLLDLGDHIGVSGYLMRTRTGELTLHAVTLTFLAKAMLALPDKYHGLEDTELRYRQRYVDLFMNTGHGAKASGPGAVVADGESAAGQASEPMAAAETALNVRETFVKRAAVLRAIRTFFDTRGYLEVETPMLHTIAGGAAARPFKTHHNALDIPLSLRIAPELYLKRLVVGGMDRVYEINRNFRNEGVSTRHNPEFTMLEFYQAYSSYHDLMDLTQELVTFVATEVNGGTICNFNGNEIDLSRWTKLTMREAIIQWWPPEAGAAPTDAEFSELGEFSVPLGRLVTALREAASGPRIDGVYGSTGTTRSAAGTTGSAAGTTGSAARSLAASHVESLVSGAFRGPDGTPEANQEILRGTLGRSIAALFETLAEEHLIQPTIVYDFPLAVSPLSKQKPGEPDWVERFEFYLGGFEVGNAFSELNDPDDQRRRFEAQLGERERGDDEAHAMDEDYVRALGYGLPPTAGEGIGIDRLTMVLTGAKSIRDVILFPLMRPAGKSSPGAAVEE